MAWSGGAITLLASGGDGGGASTPGDYDLTIASTVIDDASEGDLYIMVIGGGLGGVVEVPDGWRKAVDTHRSLSSSGLLASSRTSAIHYRFADSDDAAGSNSYTWHLREHTGNSTVTWQLFRVASPPESNVVVTDRTRTGAVSPISLPSAPTSLSVTPAGQHLTIFHAHQQDNASVAGDYVADGSALITDFVASSSGQDSNSFVAIQQDGDTDPSKTAGNTNTITWTAALLEFSADEPQLVPHLVWSDVVEVSASADVVFDAEYDAGDLGLVVLVSETTSESWTPPSGWTELVNDGDVNLVSDANLDNASVVMYTKTLSASEASLTFTAGTAAELTGGMFVIRDADSIVDTGTVETQAEADDLVATNADLVPYEWGLWVLLGADANDPETAVDSGPGLFESQSWSVSSSGSNVEMMAALFERSPVATSTLGVTSLSSETNARAYLLSVAPTGRSAGVTATGTSDAGSVDELTGGVEAHVFTSSGTFTPTSSGDVEVLIVAGGGGGGSRQGGGGGGGQVRYETIAVTSGVPVTVTVGAGGAGGTSGGAGTKGSDSSFGATSAEGGGFGGGRSGTQNGGAGGNGGGGSASGSVGSPTTGGTGVQFDGAFGWSGFSNGAGGGGGGSSEDGQSVDGSPGSSIGGDGLLYSSLSQYDLSAYGADGGRFGGGGGGGKFWTAGPAAGGGLGGGGDGGRDSSSEIGYPGTANTGGGGGGSVATANAGGAGGSGVVIVLAAVSGVSVEPDFGTATFTFTPPTLAQVRDELAAEPSFQSFFVFSPELVKDVDWEPEWSVTFSFTPELHKAVAREPEWTWSGGFFTASVQARSDLTTTPGFTVTFGFTAESSAFGNEAGPLSRRVWYGTARQRGRGNRQGLGPWPS